MRLLIFQHLTLGHPGIFRPLFTRDGIECETIRLDRGEAIPSLESYDALWVMGGEMNVQSKLDEGTTVTVVLPLAFTPRAEQPTSNIATLTPALRSANPEQSRQVKKSA